MSDDSEGLLFKGELPLAIRKLTDPPGNYQLAQSSRSNQVLLRAGLMLDDHMDLDEHHELTPFMMKQDLKMNLLIELMGEIVKSQSNFPGLRKLLLTPEYVLVEAMDGLEDALGEGDSVYLELHLLAELPKPLEFYGNVKSVGKECRIDFYRMDQHASDALEKILFRFHRRQVAQQKSTL